MNEQVNINEAVEISSDTFWVGARDDSLLQRNIYLRQFKSGGVSKANLLIDPGSPADLVGLTQKVSKLIGNLKNVNMTFLNHQDPDVAFNSGYLQKMNPNLYVLCSEDTWRLVHFYGLSPKRYRAVENFKDLKASLNTGHVLQFVPTPFCHFRGAMMLYDLESRILFTGDLFGGLSYEKDLFADEKYWEGMKAFHQLYMPTQEAIKLAIKHIRELDPPPLMIAPQHGSILTGQWVEHYMNKLEQLPVGLNLLIESQHKENYLAAMNELLLELSPILGTEAVARGMKIFREDGSFPNLIHADSHGVKDIKVDPQTAIDTLIREFSRQFPDSASVIEVATVKVLLGRNIPLPEDMVGGEVEVPEFFDVA